MKFKNIFQLSTTRRAMDMIHDNEFRFIKNNYGHGSPVDIYGKFSSRSNITPHTAFFLGVQPHVLLGDGLVLYGFVFESDSPINKEIIDEHKQVICIVDSFKENDRREIWGTLFVNEEEWI